MHRAATLAAIEGHYRQTWAAGQAIVEIPNHGRTSLAALYQKLGFRRGAEVGVWNGQHAEWLCQMNPQLELLCVDAWERFAWQATHPEPSAFVAVRREAEARLRPYKTTVLPLFSAEAAALVADGSLDFVFIDAAHGYADVVHDLALWAPKVKSGGIISGHDYETTALGWPPENGVKQAVEEYQQAYPDAAPLFLLRGTSRDRWTSYFWVQP